MTDAYTRRVMTVGSLCTGYGGIELGLRLSGLRFQTAWYAEVEPTLIDPLKTWHPGVPNIGDITAVDWAAVEPVDMIVGGIPCQPVSAAGAQRAEADPRWLWPATRTVVAARRPRYFVLENVRNLVSIRGGAIWSGILADLRALGYGGRWVTIGACATEAAHHRHRVFLLAEHGGTGFARLDAEECRSRRGASMLPTPTRRDGNGRGAGDAEYWAARRQQRDGQGIPLDAIVALLPSPRASDGSNGGPGQRGSKGDLALPSAVQPQNWGRFEAAIARATGRYGPPPPPTEDSRNGNPRLSAAFAEWLMAIPSGWVTSRLDRLPAIRAIGNGVSPPQMALAWRLLTGQ